MTGYRQNERWARIRIILNKKEMEVIKRDMLKKGLLICVVFLSAALILTPGCAKKEPVTPPETPEIGTEQPMVEETPVMEETTTPNETVSNETAF